MISDTIPRLQRLSYILIGLDSVGRNETFNQLRQSILDVAQDQGEALWPSTGYASAYRARDDYSMWTNARDSLDELMRLGLVQKRSLPRRRNLVDAHRQMRYRLTDEGRALNEYVGRGRELADALFQRLYFAHPYLQQFLSVLAKQDILIPEFNLKTMGYVEGESKNLLGQVAAEVVAKISELGLVRPDANDLENRLREYFKAKVTEKKGHINALQLVDYVNSGVQSALLPYYGLSMDHLSFDHLIGWGEELFFCNSSRHVPRIRGRVIYATSDLLEEPDGRVSLVRHGRGEFEGKVVEAIDQQFNRLKGTSPFVPIHTVRAAVCYQLKINDPLFDDVLRDIHLLRIQFSNHLSLDGGLPRDLPPGVKPLTIDNRRYFIMSIFSKNQI